MPTVHASAVLLGRHALLIRGPAGAGKSRLMLALLNAGPANRSGFARLVTDDRAEIEACHGRLLVRPPAQLRGLIEVRGLGIRRLPFEAVAVVRLVVDLAAEDAERMPSQGCSTAVLEGVSVPRVPVAERSDPIPVVLAAWFLSEPDQGAAAPLVAVHNMP
jgi:HPr kinase/phosphorylase